MRGKQEKNSNTVVAITALSFKTGADSQKSCYFIARILMFFPSFHDFSMPLGLLNKSV